VIGRTGRTGLVMAEIRLTGAAGAPSRRAGRQGYGAVVSDPPARPRMAFETHAEPAQEAGSYANALAIWHTGHEFTFDFLVSSEPPQPVRTEDGEEVIRAPHRLVARIRVPPTAVFDIIRTINQNLTLYEQRFGQIRPPGAPSPLYPPDGPDDLPAEDS
jgi:hypothetical protein